MGDGIRTVGVGSGVKPNSNPGTKTVKEKIEQLYEYQKYKLKDIIDPVFLPKMAYVQKGEKVISFFLNELEAGVDIYTEFVSREYVPEDNTRTLYHWKFNPHWKEEYEKIIHEGTGAVRYLIPINELIEIETPDDEDPFDDLSVGGTTILAESQESIGEKSPIDIALKDATLRDFAAIMLKKPISNKKWLNDLIKSK